MSQEKLYTQEDRDVYAMSFFVFALTDPRALALRDTGSPIGAILALYQDRPFIHPDESLQ